MTFDGIHVDHGAMALGADDLRRAVDAIDRRLDRLDAELAPLRHDWAGQAQGSYAVAKAAWDGAVRDLRAVLAETRVAVVQSDDAYRAADRRGAAQFGG